MPAQDRLPRSLFDPKERNQDDRLPAVRVAAGEGQTTRTSFRWVAPGSVESRFSPPWCKVVPLAGRAVPDQKNAASQRGGIWIAGLFLAP